MKIKRHLDNAVPTKAASPFTRGLYGAALGVLLVLTFSATPAFAVKSRLPLPFSPITGAGTGVTIHDPTSIAVDESNGNVFLGDEVFSAGEYATDIFGAEGAIPTGVATPYQAALGVRPSGVAIDNSATSPAHGDLYVVESQTTVKKYALNPLSEEYELVPAPQQLHPLPPFARASGVAVGSNGNVFVSSLGFGGNSPVVIEFAPSGTEIERLSTAAVGPFGAGPLAVDAAGDLFAQGVDEFHRVFKWTANGSGEVEATALPSEVPGTTQPHGGGAGLAIDTAANLLYVVSPDNEISQLNATTLALILQQGERPGRKAGAVSSA